MVCALVVAMTAPAFGGGMALPVRGVRALERGGAFVAGADDADALWQNPAGLAHGDGVGTKQLLFDIALVYQPVTYTRIDSGGNVQATVENQQPVTPIPTLAAAFAVTDRLVIGGGIAAPYAALHRYADDGAQRYASVSLAGSTFVIVTLGAAYEVSERLRVGATLQNVVSSLNARVVVSGCPGQMTCGPEARDFDAAAQLTQSDYVSPSGSVGVQYDAHELVTLGLAIQAPSRVSAPGTLALQLPSNTLFENAQLAGNAARTSFTLPPVVHAGVELHPSPALRIEAALAIELWSMHDDITIEPEDVRIENVAGTAYTVGTMTIPRNYKTSLAPSVAVEYHAGPVMFGAGIGYETAAAPATHVSVLTVDASKILVGIGGGYEQDGWQIGAAAGYAKLADVDVPLAGAAVPQLQPLRDQPAPVGVNAGTYTSSYLIAGIRMARRFR
jgi:long-chain fatty acid transport protein